MTEIIMDYIPNEIVIDIMNRSFPIPKAKFAITCHRMFALFPYSEGLNTFNMKKSTRNLIKILESGDEDVMGSIDLELLLRPSSYVPKVMSFWGRPVTTVEVISTLAGFIDNEKNKKLLINMHAFEPIFYIYGRMWKKFKVSFYIDKKLPLPLHFMILGIYLGCKHMPQPTLEAKYLAKCCDGLYVGDDLKHKQILIYHAFGFKEQTHRVIGQAHIIGSDIFKALLQYKMDLETLLLVIGKMINPNDIIPELSRHDKGKLMNQYIFHLAQRYYGPSVCKHIGWKD